MKTAIVFAVFALCAALAAANVVQSCNNEFLNARCGSCVRSAQLRQGSTTGETVPCGWCPPSPGSTSGGSCQPKSGTSACAGMLDYATRDQCPASNEPTIECDPVEHEKCAVPRDCAAGELPVPGSPPGCCPSCKPPCASGFSDSASPVCALGQVPRTIISNCTLSCKPPPRCANLEAALAAAPVCSTTSPFSIDPTTGCPSCRYPTTLDCSTVSCASVATCASGVFPERDPQQPCCPTCKPPAQCDSSTCESSVSDLRQCATGERPIFEQATCCVSCRPVDDAANRPSSNGECTEAQFKACMDARPFCEPGQPRLFDPTQSCCPACVRPLRACKLTDIADCGTKTRACESGEDPVEIEGSCCPTCIPAPPTCSPACDAASQLCVPVPPVSGQAQSPECKTFVTRTLTIDSSNSTRRDILKNFAAGNVKEIVKQMVERVCDKAEYSTACTRFRKMLVISMSCTRTSASGVAPVVLECKVPVDSLSTSRSTSVNSPDALLHAAATEENSEYQVSGTSGSTGSSSPASTSSPIAAMVAAVAIIASISLALL